MARNIEDLKQQAKAQAKQPAKTLKDLLEEQIPQMALVIPKFLTPERLVRLALSAVNKTPKLAECTPRSIIVGIMDAAALGIEIGILGQGWLVPFSNSYKRDNGTWEKRLEAQFIIGYRGLVSLSRRSKEISTITANPVYSEDYFEAAYGNEHFLKHTPNWGDRGKLLGFYAYAVLKDGGFQWDYMTVEEVKAIQARSKNGDSKNSPWATDFVEMGRKTVVRRLVKYLPMSVDAEELIQRDDDREANRTVEADFSSTFSDDETPQEEPASVPALEAPPHREELVFPKRDKVPVGQQSLDEIIDNGLEFEPGSLG